MKLYPFLLISPLVGVATALTELTLHPEQMSMTSMMSRTTNQMMSTSQVMSRTSSITTATTVILGFPVESIAAGLSLGFFVILLLRMTTKFGWSLIKRH